MKRWIPLIMLACFFTSCSDGFRIEKRHYRSGYYFGASKHEHGDEITEASDIMLEPGIETATSTSSPEQTGAVNPPETGEGTSAFFQEDEEVTRTSDYISRVSAPKDTTNSKEKRNPFTYKGPPQAKKATNLYRLGFLLILLPVLAYALAMLTGWYFLNLIGFTVIAGIALEIIALVVASEGVGKFSGSPTISDYFRKIRRRAMWVLISLAILWLLALITIVIITLFLNGY